ncbi:autotransporter outer membrane beta-barrel domain-containing protein [Parasutterella secunda]|uniref:autotransporter outer membrane beta-barrel domain-containing protein n=1 Tax=Parasutterella secunda TaxID=626947 RepID=UPI002011C01E|nr:autotransporter outer membrane beta-barrel domain-containing protein [Parasutterella secunda]MCL1597037.1 autotransporter outer membrane beta-barrel domain-containing protein [Parasutterella secunda]
MNPTVPKVDADSDISVIGRVGLRAGKAFESSDYVGELYARADVLHQFTDGQDAQFSDLSNKVGVTWGDKDTWSTFGVGGYLNWKDNMSFQVDIERTAGGETIDTWLVSGRVNYLF